MLETYKSMIERGITQISLPADPVKLYDPIRYFLKIGGKRIRPLLVLLGAGVFDRSRVELALPAAMAVELFHNFTLMHDDIMDDAPIRRGFPTVHEKWNQNVGILAGDNLLILAYRELASCAPLHLPRLLEVFNRTAQEVCEGQQLDMEFELEQTISQEAYIGMIRLKTAVLLGCALKMGAIIAGSDEEDAEHLYEFGVNMGIAFQLQDDILDVYGDPKDFGKQSGGDILANKKTILLVLACRLASGEIAYNLSAWLSKGKDIDKNQAQEKIRAVKEMYGALGVLDLAIGLKEHYTEVAFLHLEKLKTGLDSVSELRKLAQSLLTRIN